MHAQLVEKIQGCSYSRHYFAFGNFILFTWIPTVVVIKHMKREKKKKKSKKEKERERKPSFFHNLRYTHNLFSGTSCWCIHLETLSINYDTMTIGLFEQTV